MGGIGMAITGLATIPIMGDIADQYVPEQLPVQETVAVLTSAVEDMPPLLADLPAARQADVENTIALSQNALDSYEANGELPGNATANALRAITSSGVEIPAVAQAQALLGPAENYGGRMSFRYVAPLAIIIVVIFSILYWRDKQAGGYRAERIGEEKEAQATPAA
jgi:hypothetical protein